MENKRIEIYRTRGRVMKKVIGILVFVACVSLPTVAKVLHESKTAVIKELQTAGDVYLSNFDESIRGDIDVVMAAVKLYGVALKYATPKLRNNKAIVLVAVKNNGKALEFASTRLQKDREVVLASVSNNKHALRFADRTLRNNKKFLAQIEARKQHRLKQLNAIQKPYKGKTYKAKARTCYQYDVLDLLAWNSWVPVNGKHKTDDEMKPIEEVLIWVKKHQKRASKNDKLIALAVKVNGKVYRHNFIECHKKSGMYACSGEDDSGQLQMKNGMQLHLETLDFVVDYSDEPRAELVLKQREGAKWLKSKKITCPTYVVEGLNVCYDKKTADAGIHYEGCKRSHQSCAKIGKRHFGSYRNDSDAESAYYRCEQSRPNL